MPHVGIAGGVRAVLGYANRLQQAGHQTCVVSPRPRVAAGGVKRLWTKLRPGRREGQGGGSREDDPWFPLHCQHLEVPSFRACHIPDGDVVMATAWQTAPPVAAYPRSKGKKFYLVQHYEPLWTKRAAEAERTYRLPLHKIVISTWLQGLLQERLGQESVPIITPVDRQLFYPSGKVFGPARRIGMLHHDYAWKGVRDGVAAMQLVKQRYPAMQLVLFGAKEPCRDRIVEEIGMDCEYHYCPSVEELRRLYGSFDIYLCPSWFEGLGMPAMEAMACQAALVTTDTGGCRDYALHGKTALLSRPRDPAGLAAHLIRLVEDPEQLMVLALSGYAKIQEFTWEESCRRMVELFESA